MGLRQGLDHRRRRLLAVGITGVWLATPAAALVPTPRQTAGPFYPWREPEEGDADLLTVAGAPPAEGEATVLSGRVCESAGTPVTGALVEIWQCDARGRYHHVDDGGLAERDPGFQGYGAAHSDTDGRYRFRTIAPVPYGGRTPHIHIRVTAADGRELTTQLYRAGEPRNARDRILQALDAPARASLVRDFLPHSGPDARWQVVFDVVFPA